jgi:hypothetical protein
MATYAVRHSKHATLVANTVDPVKFSTKPKTVEVRNLHSTAVIFFRTDGDAPAVNGDDTDRLGPGESLQVDAANIDPPQVQLMSSSTPGYPVRAGELMVVPFKVINGAREAMPWR